MPTRIKQLDAGSVGTGTGSGPLEGVRPPKAVDSATAGSSGAAAPSLDSVHITESGRALAALSQAVQEAPEVDATRVATLQQSIASGQYGVDADRIAGSLLQLEQDLGGSSQ